MNCLSITRTGTTVTATGTSQSIALPVTSVSAPARFVRVVTNPGKYAYIKFGVTSSTATTNDILVTDVPEVYKVPGFTHVGVLQGVADTVVNLTATENA